MFPGSDSESAAGRSAEEEGRPQEGQRQNAQRASRPRGLRLDFQSTFESGYFAVLIILRTVLG